MSQGRRFAACFFSVIALVVTLVLAASAVADEAGWAAAERPGAVLLMRHALAPGTGDPANFTLDDCSTQRNLSDAGREQARRIGEAFKERGIEIDEVLTSQWCRCRETAELLDLGPVRDFPAINSFFRNRTSEVAQTRETLDYLRQQPDDLRPFLVTHQVNVTALTDVFPRSGEVIVIDVSPSGDVEVLGRILIDA